MSLKNMYVNLTQNSKQNHEPITATSLKTMYKSYTKFKITVLFIVSTEPQHGRGGLPHGEEKVKMLVAGVV